MEWYTINNVFMDQNPWGMSYAQAGGPLTAIANAVTDTGATPSELLKKYQVSICFTMPQFSLLLR